MDIRDRAASLRWWDEVQELKALVDGKWIQVRLRVCNVCEGRGHYVNPSIDSGGISPEEFERDPEFRRDYFSGMFNMECQLCLGEKVIPEPVLYREWERIGGAYA